MQSLKDGKIGTAKVSRKVMVSYYNDIQISLSAKNVFIVKLLYKDEEGLL